MKRETIHQQQASQEMTEQEFRVGSSGLADVVDQNIQSLIEWRQKIKENRTRQDTVAEAITFVSGSMRFVIANLAFFAGWITVNQGWVQIEPFDPFPFPMLTTIVSLEAILLSLFILMSQNRMQGESDKRAELDLQINLLTEHELTRVLTLLQAVADKMGIERDPELEQLNEDVTPQQVVDRIEEREKEHDGDETGAVGSFSGR